MKRISIILFNILLFAGFTFGSGVTDLKKVTLTCELSDCGSELKLFRFDGIGFRQVQEVKAKDDGSFEFEISVSDPEFYYIGKSASGVLPIIIAPGENPVLQGSCNDIRKVKITNSKINSDYADLKVELNEMKRQNSGMVRRIQYSANRPDKLETLLKEMKELDDQKLQLLESAREMGPFFERVVAINTYISYYSNQEEYKDELSYFTNEYFQFVDFSDEGYNFFPWVFESFKSFSATLASANLPSEMLEETLQKNLDKFPESSGAQQMAYGGVLTGLQQKNHSSFVPFAEDFVERFKETAPIASKDVAVRAKEAENFMVGGEAPDFSQETPDGEDLSLSDLRGKVVLVDFWASWCGPCRKENPNVVRMYKKYKDKGFEILGVSLDKQKDRWVQAIEKDNLSWHHISDLKGWGNSVAQQYGVSSIPHTILLDAEGKIIARNLRGAALEQKLEEIFD